MTSKPRLSDGAIAERLHAMKDRYLDEVTWVDEKLYPMENGELHCTIDGDVNFTALVRTMREVTSEQPTRLSDADYHALQQAYDRVKNFPELQPDGHVRLIELRNLVGKILSAHPAPGTEAKRPWKPGESDR